MAEKSLHQVLTVGVLTPHVTPGPEVEFAAMASNDVATRVVRVRSGPDAGGMSDEPPATPVALLELTAATAIDDATTTLLAHDVDSAVYASTTSAYVIGFGAETAMVDRIGDRLHIPVVGACTSAVAALRALDVASVALIGAPWFKRGYNELGAAYFRSQGFKVVSSRSAALSEEPSAIETADVCDWISGNVEDEAEAIFIGGNGFRAAGAIAPLEEALARPVLTANQVLLWGLYAATGRRCRITGYGRLFRHL